MSVCLQRAVGDGGGKSRLIQCVLLYAQNGRYSRNTLSIRDWIFDIHFCVEYKRFEIIRVKILRFSSEYQIYQLVVTLPHAKGSISTQLPRVSGYEMVISPIRRVISLIKCFLSGISNKTCHPESSLCTHTCARVNSVFNPIINLKWDNSSQY